MYKINKKKFSKRKSSIYLLIILLPFLFIFITYSLNQGINVYGNTLVKSFEEEDLNKLWEDKKYSQIVSICEEVLNENFLELNYLYFHGISNFYLGISQISLEMKIPLINQSIISLRKAFILSDGKLKGDIAYVLGKAYYYKGRSYSDLTIKYLDIATKEGYLGKDIYEFKGLAYYELGQYTKSINEFNSLPEERHSPEIVYIISEAYGLIGDYDKQEDLLNGILEGASQKNVKLSSRMDLSEIYFRSRRYSEAIKQVEEILKVRADDFDAQIILGKSLFLSGNEAEANKIFRKLIKQQPGNDEVIRWLKK
ncbi:tetratricopeptide repeat protein [Thiospirochaeta perfilievii]|uniref:Tetratricopeptide repeat protein n=1 Tax=Thiospirochaeta perfilievii TaxID=252967 RepID=A0A5C1QCP9_9SPIO|nr:tetratricopeptide repeat protein [Thiospirochaeta perfilievii]QEN05895.1 tetratricopeptide repeat protein [Thiospirochaeta perfilievii]